MIYIATGNKNKATEMGELLETSVEVIEPPKDEIQGSLEEIARHKLLQIAQRNDGKLPAIIEDTGFEAINGPLKGTPGPYIKFQEQLNGAEGLWEAVKYFPKEWRHYKATTVVGLLEVDGSQHIFKGEAKGILVSPRGSNGFGFDIIFQPDGEQRTFAEMTTQEKNRISHRGKAIQALVKYLNSY